jgi:lysocardiolipin and lysophospholipid acyltransferase
MQTRRVWWVNHLWHLLIQPDFETVLHPRTTGLRFCIQTLQPELPNLQLLDMTIGYPGVPHGKYPQDW